MASVYDDFNFMGRVNYAAQCFMRRISNSRSFDTCFEMFDGRAVVTALVRRSAKNERLHAAISSQWSGTFPQQWLDVAEEHKTIATRELSKLAASMRAEAKTKYATA